MVLNVLTYEDKDGDWMHVGDVPLEMFMDSCKRLRIIKSSDAIGFDAGMPIFLLDLPICERGIAFANLALDKMDALKCCNHQLSEQNKHMLCMNEKMSSQIEELHNDLLKKMIDEKERKNKYL